VTGPKLNERPVLRTRPGGPSRAVEAGGVSSRSVARYVRMSPYKVREVLDLVRGHDVERAQEILRFSERDAALLVSKVLASAVANAEHNQAVAAEELFVSACFADEGPTLKRWRPRARGRATRIRKRTCHVTVIVSRLPESELRKRRAARAPTADRDRRRRVSRSGGAPSPERERRVRASRRAGGAETEAPPSTERHEALTEEPAPVTDEVPTDDVPTDEAPTDEVPTDEVPTTDDTTTDTTDDEATTDDENERDE
jgi:large subunit ribosomal protein L22